MYDIFCFSKEKLTISTSTRTPSLRIFSAISNAEGIADS